MGLVFLENKFQEISRRGRCQEEGKDVLDVPRRDSTQAAKWGLPEVSEEDVVLLVFVAADQTELSDVEGIDLGGCKAQIVISTATDITKNLSEIKEVPLRDGGFGGISEVGSPDLGARSRPTVSSDIMGPTHVATSLTRREFTPTPPPSLFTGFG